MMIQWADDFLVNTTTELGQNSPSITVLTDGRFAVMWYSTEGGTSGTDIRGRIYNADGTAIGNDFIVNTTTTGDEDWPSIAALADGRFVVTWQSWDGSVSIDNATRLSDIRARSTTQTARLPATTSSSILRLQAVNTSPTSPRSLMAASW